MKIKDYKCKCGHNDFFFADKGSQKGIYCTYCGKCLKWADKDEQNLSMWQESILDKIRAEIRSYSIYVMPQYGRTIREADVLHIIDKYKEETEVEDGNDA